jgi:hypothetical protein
VWGSTREGGFWEPPVPPLRASIFQDVVHYFLAFSC